MEKGVPCGFWLSAQQRIQHIQPRDIRDSKGRAEPSSYRRQHRGSVAEHQQENHRKHEGGGGYEYVS